ncbi:MAG: tetratricopeptide repeat protein [bacterium]|nr:tetratricopeptide repeat protein [bacterium]
MQIKNSGQPVPFSECDLWDRQKDFYSNEGVNAWLNKIPFYITSNPAIAQSYANIITRFMQDYKNKKEYIPSKPFYILELGTGSGKFSFYVIKKLKELQQSLQLTGISFVYVMSDFTESNIEFWKEHPQLQEFCKEGILDFALFDIGNQEEICLVNSGITIQAGGNEEGSNPLIVISNYVFDSIPQDIFSIENGSLHIGKLNRSPVVEETQDMNDTITLNQGSTGFAYHPVKLPYYPDEHINGILWHYKKNINNHAAWLPIGALQCIKNLQKLSNNKLLLICTDKGSYKSYSHDKRYLPDITLHNSCFSISVNFDALEQYFKRLGGDCYHQLYHPDFITLNTSVFVLGSDFDALPETKHAANEYLNRPGFIDIYGLFKHIEDTKNSCSLDTLLSLLKMTGWDPEVFQRLINVIFEIKNTTPWPINTITEIRDAIPFIAENIYYLPGEDDPFSSLAQFFQEGRDFRQAIRYYQKSIELYGKKDTTFFYMGLCYYYLEDLDNALKMYQEAVELKPDNVVARGWVSQIRYEQKKLK